MRTRLYCVATSRAVIDGHIASLLFSLRRIWNVVRRREQGGGHTLRDLKLQRSAVTGSSPGQRSA